jgi:hypothetical protein
MPLERWPSVSLFFGLLCRTLLPPHLASDPGQTPNFVFVVMAS